MAKTAFTGGMYGDKFSSTTPEFGTSGMFAKCWVRNNGKIYMQKRGSSGFANSGLEPFSEYYAQQILDALDINHVEYTLHSDSKGAYTRCELFTSENIGYRPASEYFTDILTTSEGYKNLGFIKDLKLMLIADSIMMNEDRHLGNFGFIVDNDTEEILGSAPLFDHNMSLLCYAMDSDLDNIESYLTTRGHRLISGDFITPSKSYVDSQIRKKLINLYGFNLKPHPKHNLPQERLEILNRQINKQIELLLN